MTDNEPSTEEYAWVRQAYAAFPVTKPEAIDRTVAAAMAAVSSTANAHNSAAAANVRRPGGRTPWVRLSPWIALVAVLCVVIVLGEQRRRTHLAKSKPVATLSRTRLFSSTVLPDSSRHRTRTPAREPSTPLNATPSTTVPAHSLTVAMPPRTRDGDTAAPRLVASSQTPTVAPSLPTSRFQERAVNGLDSASATLVVRMLDSAQGRGLPIDGVADRIHEGVRRGVPPQRIVGVARNYVVSLDSARMALGASATVAELQAGAEALVAGTPPGALKQLRAARPAGSLVESLIALADLSTHGVAPLRASTALAALVGREGSDARVRALRAAVIADIVRGVPPDAALADRVRHSRNNGFQPFGGRVDSIPIHNSSP